MSQPRPDRSLSRRAFDGAVASAMLGLVAACAGEDDRASLSAAGAGSPAASFPVTANISKERIDLLDTDALVWLVTDYAKDKAKVQADPLYAALDVKKQGRDVFLEDGEELGSATSFISVLSLPFLLDGLVPQLAQAVDGNPATAVSRES
jgi:ABC-type Fe3+-hydroxamate transport system substrate-binding protein